MGRKDEISVSRLLLRFLEHWYYVEVVAEGDQSVQDDTA